MKRKPLQLKAETVRVLASSELSQVNGGYVAKVSSYCNNGGGGIAAGGTGSVTSEINGIDADIIQR